MPLVAKTGPPQSSHLGAKAALILSKVRKACPSNLAPTTSTLLQLALGDALAIGYFQQRGFSEDSFHMFHPDRLSCDGLFDVTWNEIAIAVRS